MRDNKVFFMLLVFLFTIGLAAQGELNIKVGDSISHLKKMQGWPQGTIKKERRIHYRYSGGWVTTQDGKIVSIPKDFEAQAMASEEKMHQRKTFYSEQIEKGLVLYKNQWITPAQKATCEAEEAARAEESKKRLTELKERKEREKLKVEERRVAALPKLLLLNWHWKMDEYGMVIVEGEVKNISPSSIKSVMAMVKLYSSKGEFLTSDDSFLELNPLEPRATTPFKIYIYDAHQAETAKISFKTFLGEAIRHTGGAISQKER